MKIKKSIFKPSIKILTYVPVYIVLYAIFAVIMFDRCGFDECIFSNILMYVSFYVPGLLTLLIQKTFGLDLFAVSMFAYLFLIAYVTDIIIRLYNNKK
jgi:hypothetical protein